MKRLAGLLGLVVLAASSAGCTYKTQTQVREVPVDYSDYAFYDRAYAPSPTSGAAAGRAVAHDDTSASVEPAADASAPPPSHGHAAGNAALGFTGGGSKQVTTEVAETDYAEVEATPGTACYEAAVKAGIQSGVCTLVSERKYVLVGERAR